ncbi:MAG TPA: glucose-1-phosphate adenylyltransferase [Steroidobacteraceae bacterium]|nr:glucose-1-phosphate adenylyltransferase [Steroidobacteraceae bacterium]
MSNRTTGGDTARFRTPEFASVHHRRPAVAPLVRDTYAVVLAGGRGTRLQQLTAWRAKPAVPFGGKHRIIDFALSNCINSGVRRIGVATQYKAHSLIQHLRHGWSFLDSHLHEFLDVLPAQQRVRDGWYDGTADALYQNLDILRMEAPRFVLVLAGDHVYKMDYGVMLSEHVERHAEVSIACTDVPLAAASAFGVVRAGDDGKIRDFTEKPSSPAPISDDATRALVSMGIYIFNADALYDCLRSDAHRPDSTHDFGRDLLPHLLREGRRVMAHRFSDSCVNTVDGRPYWRDVGTVDAYWETNIDLTRARPELNMYDPEWPIRTLEEGMPPAKFIFESPDPRGQTLNSLVSSGCVVSGAAIIRSLLFTDVLVAPGSVIEDSIVLPAVRIGRGVRLRRVILDKFCELPDGFVAGIDRATDEARFHVTDQGVVLVTPEMLGQRLHDYS